MLRLQLPDSDLETLIDDADLALVSGFSWRPLYLKYQTYVHAWNREQHFLMHRLILGVPEKALVDHIDGNTLNNQRSNLRKATGQQNQANSTTRTGKSQFKGVYWDSSRKKWATSIHVNRKSRSLGRYTDEEAAARAYDAAAIEAWGEYARLNFPLDNGAVTLN